MCDIKFLVVDYSSFICEVTCTIGHAGSILKPEHAIRYNSYQENFLRKPFGVISVYRVSATVHCRRWCNI